MPKTKLNEQKNIYKEFWQGQKITLAFFSDEMSSEKKNIIIFIILTVCSTIVNFVVPYYTQKLIDVAIPKNNIKDIALYSTFIIGSIFLSFFINFEIIRKAAKISQNIFKTLREKLMFKLLSKNPIFFNRFSSGDIMTRFSNDLDNIYNFFYSQLLYSFIFIVAALGYMFWLIYMNWILALCTISLYLLSMVIIKKSYCAVFARANKVQTEYSNLNDSILDTITGAEDIRIYHQKNKFVKQFDIINKSYATSSFSLYFFKDTLWSVLEHIFKLSAFAPIVIGAIMMYYKAENVTLGLITTFSQIAIYCSGYISYFEYVLLSTSSISVSVNRVNELFNTSPESEISGLTVQQTPDTMDIEFRNVSFSYQPQKFILKNLNLKINSGEKIALMAPSGYGKSTLANLILRFHKPDSGNIYLGGKDIWSYPENFYLSFFSYVSQNTHIFKRSIKENIEIGWYIPDTEILTRILKTLQLSETIKTLPQGINTILNKDGVSLSEGQKQRIALGRALIREPQFLLLDEFTSGLDHDIEKSIIDDLLKLIDKQTIICITHSQYVASKMDRIIYLPDIIEN